MTESDYLSMDDEQVKMVGDVSTVYDERRGFYDSFTLPSYSN